MSASKKENETIRLTSCTDTEKTYLKYLDLCETIKKGIIHVSDNLFFHEKVLGFYAFLLAYFIGNLGLGMKIIEWHRKKISENGIDFQTESKMDVAVSAYQLYRAVWLKEEKKGSRTASLLDEMISFLIVELQETPSKKLIQTIEKAIEESIYASRTK